MREDVHPTAGLMPTIASDHQTKIKAARTRRTSVDVATVTTTSATVAVMTRGSPPQWIRLSDTARRSHAFALAILLISTWGAKVHRLWLLLHAAIIVAAETLVIAESLTNLLR
jgi:hypothetical protein